MALTKAGVASVIRALTQPTVDGIKRFAFRDIRSTAELLSSGRPPKSLKFIKNNPVSKKLIKLKNKVAGKLGGLAGKAAAIKAKADNAISKLPLASKIPYGQLGQVAAARIAGHYAGKIAQTKSGGKLINNAVGAATTAVTVFNSAKQIASIAELGVSIVEELDPRKIRRPLSQYADKISASASAQGKELAATVAASVLSSLVSGAPLGSGLPSPSRAFKTAASLANSPRFFNPTQRTYTFDAEEQISASKAVRHVPISTPASRLYPQAGLLEDEIMYRLTLLAENVYLPTQNKSRELGFGTPRILEGFRAENSATSQHERGEAIDITVGTIENCYALAQWMKDHIMYDQLILCHDISGQAWIHASFRLDSRRRNVLTKTYNDQFVDGLHVYDPPIAIGTTVVDADTQTDIAEGEKFIELLSAREQRLHPIGLDSDAPQNSKPDATAVGGGGNGDRCVVDPTGKPYVPNNSTQQIVIDTVTALLQDPAYLAMAQASDRRVMVPFARELARRAGVGMNAVRGNGSDPSGDAIAILNPTGAKGFGSWDAEKRVQIMDVVGNAHGGPGTTPRAQWIDVTSVCADDTGGGYIVP